MAPKNVCVLGSLQIEIFAFVWQNGSSTPGEIYDHLHAKRGIAYTTVTNTLKRMVERGLLTRYPPTKGTHGPTYTPALTKTALITTFVQRLLIDLEANDDERQHILEALVWPVPSASN